MKRKILSLLICLGTVLALPGSAAAYTFTGGYFADTAAGVGDNDLDFCIQPNLPGNSSQGTTEATAAINYWKGAVVLSPASTVNCANANVILTGAPIGASCSTVGQTSGSVANDTQATITLNTLCSWYVFSSLPITDGQNDLRTILTHEIGHALGLGHQSPQKVMTVGQCAISSRISGLSQDDANGVRARYNGALTPTSNVFPTSTTCLN